MLGKHLKYSSGYWPTGAETLDESETAMLEMTCQRSELEDGMDILELGCGWGSLTCFMAARMPNAKIMAVSNSNDQRKYIEQRCEQNGYGNVTVITADMNDFTTSEVFDRVVSVEMFEHMRNYDELLRRISNYLTVDGKLFVHIFSHESLVYPFEDNGPSDWMGREFFSGGQMPSHRLLLHFQKDLKIEKSGVFPVLITVKLLGLGYAIWTRIKRLYLRYFHQRMVQIMRKFGGKGGEYSSCHVPNYLV